MIIMNINHQWLQVKQNKPTKKLDKQIQGNLCLSDELVEDKIYVHATNRGNSKFRMSVSNQPAQLRGKNIGANPTNKQVVIPPMYFPC